MWIFAALSSALFVALENIFTKRSGLHFNAVITTWAILFISALFYVPILLTVPIPHHLNEAFWEAVVLRLFLDTAALLLYVKSLHMAPVALVSPMSSLLSVFVLLFSLPFGGTFPSLFGVAAIGIILVGVYLLHFDHDTKHLLSPFIALRNNKGVQLALGAVVLWGIVVLLKRVAIDHSSVLFYTSFFQILWAALFTPVAIIASRRQFLSVFSKKSVTHLLPLGLLDGLQVLAYNIAIKLTLPSYASAVRSTAILFSALFAWLFFREKLSARRIVPIVIIVVGVALIALTHK